MDDQLYCSCAGIPTAEHNFILNAEGVWDFCPHQPAPTVMDLRALYDARHQAYVFAAEAYENLLAYHQPTPTESNRRWLELGVLDGADSDAYRAWKQAVNKGGR